MYNTRNNIWSTVENGVDMCLNIASLAVAYMFATLFRVPETVSSNVPRTIIIIFLVVLLQSFVFQSLNLYRSVPFINPNYILGKIVRANLIYYLIVDGITLALFDESRDFMFIWMLISAIISTAVLLFKKRIIIYFVGLIRKRRHYTLRRVVIVGDNSYTAAEFVREVRKNADSGMMVIGYVGDKANPEVGCDRLGSFESLGAVLDEHHPTDVVFAIDGYGKKDLIRLVNICDDRCIKVYFLPVVYGYFKTPRQIEPVGALPVINIHYTPLDGGFNSFIKRAFDIVGSLALIVLTLPIMLAAAIGVLISSPGPVFFVQERVGKMGKSFKMLKFRSMMVNVDSENGWTTGDDPRKTKFGTFIRRTSIDELPQLFNVLLGDMSLVGPRPEIPRFVEYFKETVPLYMVKHYVKPGMTGLAQIRGLRGDTSIEDRINADIEYIENWSLLLDLEILLKTPAKAINKQEQYFAAEPEEARAQQMPTADSEVTFDAAFTESSCESPDLCCGGGVATMADEESPDCETDESCESVSSADEATPTDVTPAAKDGESVGEESEEPSGCADSSDGEAADGSFDTERASATYSACATTDTDTEEIIASSTDTSCSAEESDTDEITSATDTACVGAEPDEEKAEEPTDGAEDAAHTAETPTPPKGRILYAASTMSHINNFHLDYIRALREEGYEVKIMARGEGADFNLPFEKKFFSAANAACRARIRRIFERESFDIVFLNTSLAAFHIRLSLPRENRPRVVNMVHGYLFSKDVGLVKRSVLFLSEWLLRGRTDTIITMNEWDRTAAERYNLSVEGVHHCLGMGAVVKPCEASPEELRGRYNCQNKFIMTFAGDMSARKNQEFLIYALSEIKDYIPNAVLWLVGDGVDLDRLRRIAGEVDLSESVFFMGRQKNACDFMRASDLYVSASSTEGLPFNVIEAMGCGCTVLASAVKGHVDLITDGVSGHLFRFGSLDDFVSRVRKIESGELRLNKADVERRYLEFAKETVFDETLNTIKETFEKKDD